MQKAATPIEPGPSSAESRDRLKAIGLMIVAVTLFACLDATAKYLTSTAKMPVWQIVWVRFIGQFAVIVLALGLVSVPRLLTTKKPGQQMLRSCLLMGSTVFNFLALRYLRLDQTLTIMFLGPLVVALVAGPLLGEWVGWRRMTAILVGFLGILVVIRPGFAEIHPAVLYALAGMLSYVGFMLITRTLSGHDPAEVTLTWSLLAGIVIAAPLAFADWAWPTDPMTIAAFALLGFWGGAGHYAFILSTRLAPASTVAPFLYVQLVSVTILGYTIFGDLPDGWTLAGSAIVIASGIYLVHRERVVGARTQPSAGS